MFWKHDIFRRCGCRELRENPAEPVLRTIADGARVSYPHERRYELWEVLMELFQRCDLSWIFHVDGALHIDRSQW